MVRRKEDTGGFVVLYANSAGRTRKCVFGWKIKKEKEVRASLKGFFAMIAFQPGIYATPRMLLSLVSGDRCSRRFFYRGSRGKTRDLIGKVRRAACGYASRGILVGVRYTEV